jgi:hypothetical protein
MGEYQGPGNLQALQIEKQSQIEEELQIEEKEEMDVLQWQAKKEHLQIEKEL